jgi:hypothetical protein
VDQRSGGHSAPSEEVEYVNDAGREEFDPDMENDEPDAAATLARGGRDEEPDVLLDVPELRVDEISLEVEELRARVALQADVLALLKLHVGVEAELGRVQLTIKGVEATVLLKVRLDNVARIIDRVLTTIDNNPDIVERLIEQVGEAAEEVGTGASQAFGELGTGAGSAVEGVGKEAETAVGGVGRGARRAVKDVGQGGGQAVDDVAEEVRQKRPRGGEPRQPTERRGEGRGRRGKADSPKKRSAKGSRTSRDRRSEEG